MDNMTGILIGEVLGLQTEEAIYEALLRETQDGDSEDSVLDDYCTVPDTNAGYPKSLSGSLKSLLDNGKSDLLINSKSIKMPPKGFEKETVEKEVEITPTDKNPYDIMLRAKAGQPIELATLASYLGSAVHLQVSSKIINADGSVGDGFSLEGRDGLNDEYLTTVPKVSLDLESDFGNICLFFLFFRSARH